VGTSPPTRQSSFGATDAFCFNKPCVYNFIKTNILIKTAILSEHLTSVTNGIEAQNQQKL
jgi:hypothetical protein